jgi:hypothetical protein
MVKRKNTTKKEATAEATVETNPPVPYNVMASNQEPTPIKAFTEEGDIFEGKSREDIIEELGKTGVDMEEATGVVVEDGVTGEKIPGFAKDLPKINSLQELEPENIKKFLSNMVKQNLQVLIPEDLTDEEAEEIINSIEKKIISLDRKEIKNLDPVEIKNIYGSEVFNQIKKFNPTDYVKLARKLLVDFKDGIVEYQDIIDATEEINRHIKFFQDLDIDNVQKGIRETIENDSENYPTEFHKYKKYLEMYLDYLNSKEGYENNPFMEKEKEVTAQKIRAVEEALDFRHIYSKCENGKQKILRDFKTPQVLNKAIFDFIGKLSNDNSINVAFPIPANFNVKVNASEALTAVWITFLEMSILRGKFENIKNITPSEYVEMVQIIRGETPKKSDKKKKDENVKTEDGIDIKKFVEENNITIDDVSYSRKAAIAISYIIARTFKPTVINNSTHMKYVLSYTMKLLTQSFVHDGCNKLLLELVNGVKERLK